MKKVKKDAYQEVTNIVVAQLEQAIEDRKANGKTGWTKPWVAIHWHQPILIRYEGNCQRLEPVTLGNL